MEVWNLIRLKNQIDNMRQHKRTSTEEYVIYVLSPFVQSLGYDIYDVGQVDIQVTAGRVVVRPVAGVNVVFSVSSRTPSNAKVFVHLDMHKEKLNVYMFSMHKWEIVDVVDLSDITETNTYTYSSVLRVIAQEAFQIMYAEREERMFTERILRSKLEAGEMNNDFTTAALKLLIEKPTEAFLMAIAEVLAHEFSTDDRNELYGMLQPMHLNGIRDIVSDYMKNIPQTKDTPESVATSTVKAPPQPAYAPEPTTYVAPQPAYDIEEALEDKPVTPPVVEEPKAVVESPKAEEPKVVEPVAVKEEPKVEVTEEVKDPKMDNLLRAINQQTPTVEEAPQTQKTSVSVDDVIGKKPAGDITSMFGGERKTPRTKSL